MTASGRRMIANQTTPAPRATAENGAPVMSTCTRTVDDLAGHGRRLTGT